MALMGAEILLYPTAIGSEPQDPDLYSCEHWRRVMQGHAGANVVCNLSVVKSLKGLGCVDSLFFPVRLIIC